MLSVSRGRSRMVTDRLSTASVGARTGVGRLRASHLLHALFFISIIRSACTRFNHVHLSLGWSGMMAEQLAMDRNFMSLTALSTSICVYLLASEAMTRS